MRMTQNTQFNIIHHLNQYIRSMRLRYARGKFVDGRFQLSLGVMNSCLLIYNHGKKEIGHQLEVIVSQSTPIYSLLQ